MVKSQRSAAQASRMTTAMSSSAHRRSVAVSRAGVPDRLSLALSFALLSMTAAALMPTSTYAAQTGQASAQVAYAIQPGKLSDVLAEFAAASGVLLVFDPQRLAGRQSEGLQGSFSVRDGFARLLRGSGYEAVDAGDAGYALRQLPLVSDGQATTLSAVTVSGAAGGLPQAYAGGQVATGARLGVLGNVDIMDAPFSINSYTSQKVADDQAITVADVLANDPAVRVQSNSLTTGNLEGDFFNIRGFSVYGSEMLVNGLYGVAPSGVFPVEGMERVEVLRGPNAFLNGMSAIGGVGGSINVAPKRATEDPITNLTASYMSDGNVGGHLDLGRRFGDEKQWGVRFNGAYRDGRTYTDGQSLSLGTATLGLDYASRRFRASLDAGYVDRDLEGGALYSFNVSRSLPFVPGAPKPSLQFGQDWEYSKTESAFVVAKAEYDFLPAWTVTGALGYGEGRSDTLYSHLSIMNVNGDGTADVSRSRSDTKTLSGQLGVSGRFDTGPVNHQVSLTGSVSRQDAGSTYGSTYVLKSYATNIYDPVTDISKPSLAGFPATIPRLSRTTLTSYALSDRLSVLDERLQLTLGGRFQEVKTNRYNASGAVTSSYKSDRLTPAVGLVVKPTDNLSLYANYIEGLQPGAIVGSGFVNAGEVLPPYVSKQIEVGAKYDFGSFTLTTALFEIKQRNAITIEDPVTGLRTYKADGMQRNRGIDISAFGEIEEGLRVLGGVVYMDAKLDKTEGGLQDGHTASGVAKWQANFGMDWDTPFLHGLTLSGRVISTSAVYVRTDNALRSPGWTRFDIGARYATKAFGNPLTVRFNIENVANKRYWAAANGNSFIGLPRIFKLSATMAF